MSPPAHALAVAADIKNDVVIRARGGSRSYCVQLQIVTHLPCDHVVRARRVAADAQRPDNVPAVLVQRQPASEDDDASDRLAHIGIVVLTELLRISSKRRLRIRRSTGCQTVQTLPRF